MIKHRDYRSFYPSTIICDGFPTSKFFLYYKRHNNEKDIEMLKFCKKYKDKKCMLINVLIRNCRLKRHVTAPYLSFAKASKNIYLKRNIINDNGRVLQFKGAFSIWVTELDLDIIKRQYNATFTILEIYVANKGSAPKYLKESVNEFFKIKNEISFEIDKIKNKDKIDSEKLILLTIEYMKIKNKLNGIFGMCATNPVRKICTYNFSLKEWKEEENKAVSETLQKFYRSKNNFMQYQIGIWVTANCRYRLINMIEKIGYDKFLYCDTDSIFYYSTPKIEEMLENINKENLNIRLQRGEYVKINDKIIEYMAFCDEGENIKFFKALHSKCYGYIDDKGMHLTIAGVSKYFRSDSHLIYSKRRTREQELKNLENLKGGFKFIECGGTTSFYLEKDISVDNINGHIIENSSGCIISDSEKEIRDSIDLKNYEIFDYQDNGRVK